MKPNVKLNSIIALAMDLADQGKLTTVNIGGNSKTVQVFLETESKVAGLDDKDAMNAISYWLSLAQGAPLDYVGRVNKVVDDAAQAVGDIAEAKAEAAKAVKQEVDAPRFKRVRVSITAAGTAPGVLSS